VNRTARLAAAGASAALVLTGCGSAPVLAGAAVVIGTGRISTEMLARTVDEGLADPAAAQVAADRPAYQRQVLGRLITAQIVDEAARRHGVNVTATEVDGQFALIQDSVGGAQQLQSQAAAAGFSIPQLRDLARTRAQTGRLGDTLTADLPVSQQQLERAYQAGIDGFDRVRTAQVQLASLADAEALLPQASALSDRAFGDLARTRSLDEATKAAGGDLGLLPRSALVTQGLDEYAKAAFAAAAGDTFVVASARGGYVVRVLERQTTTLAAATQQLRRSILQSQGNAAVQKVLTETSAALDIRVNPRFGGWDTNRLQVTLRTATGNNELSSPQAPPGGPSAPVQDPLPPQQ